MGVFGPDRDSGVQQLLNPVSSFIIPVILPRITTPKLFYVRLIFIFVIVGDMRDS